MHLMSATRTGFASSLFWFALTGVAVLGAGGCSTVTRYYTLSQVDGAAPLGGRASSGSAVIAVGPVSLPDYVDRPQIVLRTSANTVAQATFDQWGGSLDDMVPRLLVGNLAARLPADHLVSFPQVSDLVFDYRVSISISQFDVSSAGEAVIAASWQVRGRPGSGAIVVRDTVVRAQAAGASYEDRVAALSRALGDLTDAIATVLASQPRAAVVTAASGPKGR